MIGCITNTDTANISTLIIGIVLAIIVGLVIYSMIKDKKNGKSSCGGNCKGCSGCSMRDFENKS